MILPDLSRADYDAMTAVNWSTLCWMARSPAHYRYHLEHRRKDTPALKMGRARHVATLEPETFAGAYVLWDAERKGNAWKEFKARHAGREILTVDEYEDCLAFARAVRAHPVAGRFLKKGMAEFSITWTMKSSSGHEFKCKARPDFCSAMDALLDLKSTGDASVGAFGRTVINYGYHGQGAFYSDGFKAATGRELPFYFVPAEGAEPYVTAVYRVPDGILEMGREHYQGLLDRLALCIETDEWPGYAEDVELLTLPGWAMPRADEEDISGLDLNFNAGE